MSEFNRRDFVTTLGAATLAAGAARAAASGPTPSAAPAAAPEAKHHNHGAGSDDCLDNCRNCEWTCLQTVQHCLQKGGEHARAAHIAMLLDCAAVCRASATLMVSDSEFSPRMCGICADICDKCAQSCAKVPGDEHMKACIDACKRCVESCRKMSK